MRLQSTTGFANQANSQLGVTARSSVVEGGIGPIAESDVQVQITRLSAQANALEYVVKELSARLGPLLFPESVNNDSTGGVPAQRPAGTQLAQAISDSTDRLVSITHQLNDVQNRLGI